mgnify:CR=1 FL=1
MTGPLYRLGRFSARHWKAVIALWLIGVLALALAGRAAGDRTADNLTLPGTDSTQASDLLEQSLPDQAYGSNPLVLQLDSGKLTGDKHEKAIHETVDALEKSWQKTKCRLPSRACPKITASRKPCRTKSCCRRRDERHGPRRRSASSPGEDRSRGSTTCPRSAR